MLFSTEPFSYNPRTLNMYVEASELDEFIPAGYIRLKSHRTGRIVEFVLMETQRDGEGDVTFWRYEPITEDLWDTLQNVIIFND